METIGGVSDPRPVSRSVAFVAPTLAMLGLAVGIGLGLTQPILVVVIGPGIAAGPTWVGLVFLGSAAAALLAAVGVLIRAIAGMRGRGALAISTFALTAGLAGGILVGDLVAVRQGIGFATPAPRPTPHPTGPGWTATHPMLEPRADHSATLLADGRVLVAGGGGDRGVTNSAELYDPRSESWTGTGSMDGSRSGHRAIRLADGRVLVIDRSGHADLYDPLTGRWRVTGSIGTREGFAAVPLTDGRLLLCGGRNTSTGASDGSALLFDPATDAWTSVSAMHGPRAGHVATLLADGRVLVAGGQDQAAAGEGNMQGFLSTAEIFDPVSATWAIAASMESHRSEGAAVRLDDGRVVVAGGTLGLTGLVEIFDPTRGTWSAAGHTSGWMQLRALLLADARVLFVDGTGSVELYDPGISTTTRVGSSGQGFGAAVTLLDDGRVLFTGGRILRYPGPSVTLADAQAYSPR